MHRYLAFQPDSANVKCSLNHKVYFEVTRISDCSAHESADKHNLTLLRNRGRNRLFLSSKSFGVLLPSHLHMSSLDDLIYEIIHPSFNFVTITDPASLAGGVETFVSPLDLDSWICVLISIITVSGFLTGLMVKFASPLAACGGIYVDKIITITCILLGQVGESSGKAYRVGKVAIVLMILWLFGNLIVMANFYQGSIYSCLTVLFPPETPRNAKDLVNWDIPMISMEGDGKRDDLLDDLIPNLLSKTRENLGLDKFLKNF